MTELVVFRLVIVFLLVIRMFGILLFGIDVLFIECWWFSWLILVIGDDFVVIVMYLIVIVLVYELISLKIEVIYSTNCLLLIIVVFIDLLIT